MQPQPKNNRSSVGFIAGAIAAILVAGGGAAWWALQNLTQSPPQPVNPEVVKSPDTPDADLVERGSLYWMNAQGETIESLSQPLVLSKSADKETVLKTAIERLLAGTNDPSYASNIPPQTKLLSANMDKTGIHLNLSQAFTEGGGSASMQGRLQQVLYTATSIDPQAQVWLSVEGEPLELLGGEGILVAQPMTRQWFETEFASFSNP